MQKQLINASFLTGVLACIFLAGCSSVKDLTNVSVWPFGGRSDAPRVYLPANSTPYLCEGNKKFYVRMLDQGASVWLILPEREVLLPQSGSNKVYSNGISKLDLTNEAVTLDVNQTTKYVACKANEVAKVAKIEASNSAQVVKSDPVALAEVEHKPKPASEKTWFDKLKFWDKDESPKPVPLNKVTEMAKAVEPAPMTKEATPVAIAPITKEDIPAVIAPSEQVVEDVNAVAEKLAGEQVVETENINQDASINDEKLNDKEAVIDALNAWAKAWRTKNTDGYLNAYSAKFKPEGMSYKAWVAQRKKRVGGNPTDITLDLDKVNVVAEATKAEVKFIQRYASGKFSDSVVKVLRFENEGGHWLIIKESLLQNN